MCVIFFPRLAPHVKPGGGGQLPFCCIKSRGGVEVPHREVGLLSEFWGNAQGFFFGPYIRWEDLAMVLCMGFSHGFGNDDFMHGFCT